MKLMKPSAMTLLLFGMIAATASARASSIIPPSAVATGDLVGSSRWEWKHDAGTPGTSTGYSDYAVASPSLDQAARKFHVAYSDHGGEIYHLSFGNDPTATHFVYDTYVYLTDPSQLKNLEMDMNQVMPDGKTVIFGTQCSGYSGTWEFVTVYGKKPHWNVSNIACDPAHWESGKWHHVQIASSRTSEGVVTYEWINLDGKVSYFSGAKGSAALSLGWTRGDLLLNFQMDGSSKDSGSMTVYIDKMKIYRW
jgi:hypothetical protein